MKEFKNKDAYKLIRYHCAGCGTIEYVWNSGDTEVPDKIQCARCPYPALRARTNQGRNPDIQIPGLTPLGIRWFVTESKKLYIKRIKQQIIDMKDVLFQDTSREIVEKSLIEAYLPGEVHLVDPLTLNFEEQVEVLLSDK